MLLPDWAPGWWALAGAAATLLLVAVAAGARRRRAGRPPWSLANGLTWVAAVGCVVAAGEAVYTVLRSAVPDHPWVAWLGVSILEVPMLAFALRAREASRPSSGISPEPYIRMTWMLAGGSSVIAALAYAPMGPAVMVLRAITPIIGAALWHAALKIEAKRAGTAPARLTRWRWTPDRILTHLGLLTAAESQTEDAEIHMRLTKVADAVIRGARSARRHAERPGRVSGAWYGWRVRRLERVYRAAERDLDLTRQAGRYRLLEEIIASRNAAPQLMLLAGARHADLGLPEPGPAAGRTPAGEHDGSGEGGRAEHGRHLDGRSTAGGWPGGQAPMFGSEANMAADPAAAASVPMSALMSGGAAGAGAGHGRHLHSVLVGQLGEAAGGQAGAAGTAGPTAPVPPVAGVEQGKDAGETGNGSEHGDDDRRVAVARLLEADPTMTGAAIGRELGVSETHGRRLAREVRATLSTGTGGQG